MGRYAIEPDNATKSAKAKGSNLRVHFKNTREKRKKTAVFEGGNLLEKAAEIGKDVWNAGTKLGNRVVSLVK